MCHVGMSLTQGIVSTYRIRAFTSHAAWVKQIEENANRTLGKIRQVPQKLQIMKDFQTTKIEFVFGVQEGYVVKGYGYVGVILS